MVIQVVSATENLQQWASSLEQVQHVRDMVVERSQQVIQCVSGVPLD